MRRVGLRGMAAALMVGLGAVVATTRGADYDGKAAEPKGLLSGILGEKPRTSGRPASGRQTSGRQGKKTIEEPPQPLPTVESASVKQQRLMNAWFRRVEVCDRLRAIADQSGNEALRNQANELEERATAIYRQQTSGLPLAAQALPSTGDGQQLASERKVAATPATAKTPNPQSASKISPPSNPTAARLSGSFDQREQAILNGSSMGGN